MFQQLGLIGCGLMGGSFALAARRAGLVARVVGYSASLRTTARAQELGVIDARAACASQAAMGADLILLAVPVAATESALAAIRHLLTPQTLVMDVGSTKADVAAAARRALGDGYIGAFVPAHPIAGKECAGVDHADPDLYHGCQVVLTPTEATQPVLLRRAEALWRALGCRVTHMTPEAHDAALAAVSHLPHLLALAYMHGLLGQPRSADFLALAGPGFRDFTRIAASDPALWRDVLQANKQELLAQSRAFQQALHQFEQAVTHDDGTALHDLIAQTSAARAGWKLNAD